MDTLRPHWREPAADVAWVGEGWRELVLACHGAVVARFPEYELVNVKQKYGVLAFQAFPRPRRRVAASWTAEEFGELDRVIQPFVEQSEFVCEWCGARGRLRDDRKYLLTLCDTCEGRFPDPPRPGDGRG